MNRTTAGLGSIAFFFAAPFTVAGVVPWCITRWQLHKPIFGIGAARYAGLALCAAGCAVLIDSFVRFAKQGRGTPAPMAPTSQLVITGTYRYVRNPMYVAVLSVVLGQVLFFGDVGLAIYAAILCIVFHAFVTLYEEPTLRRQFRGAYDEYRRHVPRWIPRLKAWRERDHR